MSAPVLLILLNGLDKRDKMRDLPSILLLFCNEFNKYNNTGARRTNDIFYQSYDIKITLKSHFWRAKNRFCHYTHVHMYFVTNVITHGTD